METFDDPAVESTLAVEDESPAHRIAVVPFSNLSGDEAEDYFCEGIAVEILICLARTPDLSVVARSAVYALRGEDLSAPEIGRRLNASWVLTGDVHKLDDRIQITVELIDVAAGRARWTGSYDRELLDILAIQDEITESVHRSLDVERAEESGRNIQSIHTSDFEAYDFYLRGRQLYTLYSRQAIESACVMFERAIDIDAGYALAYCGLADCYAYLYMYVESSEENLRRAEAASARALELDDQLAEAWASRGVALSLRGRYGESDSAFERAIALDPKLFEARFLYARSCRAQGKTAKAAELFEASNRIRPEDYQSLLIAGQVYHELGERERGDELRRRGIAVAEEQLSLNPEEARALYLGANGLVGLGEGEKGLEWLEKALAVEPDDPMLLYNAGCVYALLGRKEEALTCLDRAVAGGLRQKGWFENDSDLDSIRDDLRFGKLTKQLV